MSDAEPAAKDEAKKPEGQASTDPQTPEEWKPEPRKWTWKDIFTAPMLAFKPKCMVISLVTIALLALFYWLWQEHLLKSVSVPLLTPILTWVGYAIAAVIFGLGATFVAVFMKADLLDDEFLTLKEAIGQYKGRILPALLVPLFLVGLLAGFRVLMWLSELVGSIPYLGSLLYAILYPLGFLLGIFTVLLCIGICLASFVGPAVVAVRKHGWFDNVIDTFEAVGTKPHILIASLLVTAAMMTVGYYVPNMAMALLARTTSTLPGLELALTEERAQEIRGRILNGIDPFVLAENWASTRVGGSSLRSELITDIRGTLGARLKAVQEEKGEDRLEYRQSLEKAIAAIDAQVLSSTPPKPKTPPTKSSPIKDAEDQEDAIADKAYTNGYYQWITGLITGLWQTAFAALVLGYVLNVFLAGGILTYLNVREDDYWDDEDLEDLDKLAKELEDEAKKEEETAKKEGDKPEAAAAKPAEAAPDEAAKTSVDLGAGPKPDESAETKLDESDKPDENTETKDEEKKAT